MLTDDKKNIVLIGMPGVGKSTIGVLLAKHLGYSFLDTDILIQATEGKTLQQLIQKHGIPGFCELEQDYILSISLSCHVIATGGSVVYGKAAMKHLKTDSVVIHLDLSLDRLQKRLDDLDARGGCHCARSGPVGSLRRTASAVFKICRPDGGHRYADTRRRSQAINNIIDR